MKWLSFLSSPVEAVADVFKAKEERRKQVELSKINRLQSAEDKLAEWEMIQAESQQGSWKSEWVTVIITLPIPVIFISVFLSVLLGSPIVAEAAREGTDAIKELVPNYEEVLLYVVLAAIGIRAIGKK